MIIEKYGVTQRSYPSTITRGLARRSKLHGKEGTMTCRDPNEMLSKLSDSQLHNHHVTPTSFNINSQHPIYQMALEQARDNKQRSYKDLCDFILGVGAYVPNNPAIANDPEYHQNIAKEYELCRIRMIQAIYPSSSPPPNITSTAFVPRSFAEDITPPMSQADAIGKWIERIPDTPATRYALPKRVTKKREQQRGHPRTRTSQTLYKIAKPQRETQTSRRPQTRSLTKSAGKKGDN
jgi:hypothetical protein